MITLENVTKSYSRTTAIDHLSLELEDNKIYCLLGKNGAGKTTLMKLISGHIQNYEGTIKINGKDVATTNITAESVNFIASDSQQFDLSVNTILDAACAIQDNFDKKFANHMIKKFELNTKKKYSELSYGMKTMLTTILCLSNKSKIILLDEPVLGFDAVMREQFNTLVQESFAYRTCTIVISTHIIDEIAKVAQKLIIIDNGKKVILADIDDIDEKGYTLAGKTEIVAPITEKLNCISKTILNNTMVAYIYDERITPPFGVTLNSISLQDFFIKIVGGSQEYEQ